MGCSYILCSIVSDAPIEDFKDTQGIVSSEKPLSISWHAGRDNKKLIWLRAYAELPREDPKDMN